MIFGLGLLAFVLGVHVSSMMSTVWLALLGVWPARVRFLLCGPHKPTNAPDMYLIGKRIFLFCHGYFTVQWCCVGLTSVMKTSGSKHCVQYYACPADSALRVMPILIHCGQRVGRLPRCLLC